MVWKKTPLSMYVDERSSITLVERRLKSSMKEHRTISSLCQVREKEESGKTILPIRHIRDTIPYSWSQRGIVERCVGQQHPPDDPLPPLPP